MNTRFSQPFRPAAARRSALLSVLAVLLLSGPAAAQEIYKSRGPDGRMIYSDKPPADAGKVETIDQSRVIIERSNSEERRRLSSGAKAASKDGTGSQAAAKADTAIKSAQDALAKAKKAQADGVEPLPGERTGIVSKKGSTNTRLNDDYEERQKTLRDAVDAAQANLEAVTARQARAAKN